MKFLFPLLCLFPLSLYPSDLTLRPLTTGSFKANTANLYEGGPNASVWIPIPVYVIRHPQGIILFDSGLGTRFNREVEGWWVNRLLQYLLPHRLDPQDPAVEQLKLLGIQPEVVKTIIASHLHFDHAGGLRDFPQAQVVVARAEWESAQVGRWKARVRGIMKEQLEGIQVWPIDYQPGTAWGPFVASFDLFGDGSLLLLSTPGHTPGHQSLLVTLGSGKKVLLTGDAVWVRENYEVPTPKGRKARLVEEADKEAWETTLKIREFHQQNPDVLIIPGHDPKVWQELPPLLE